MSTMMQYLKCPELQHQEHTFMVWGMKAVKVMEMAGLLLLCKSSVSPEQAQDIGNISMTQQFVLFSDFVHKLTQLVQLSQHLCIAYIL